MKFIYEITLKNQFNSTFYPLFHDFENLSHVLTLHTLSSVYIHGLKEGCTRPNETLTSTYEMGLNVELVPLLDRRR